MNYYLYLYTNKEDSKGYIGVTNNLRVRHNAHIRGSSGAKAFNSAVKKYGIGAFYFRVLAIFDDIIEVARIEQASIKAFGTLAPSGYNLNGGAPFTRYSGPLSEETRAKLSNVGKKNKGKKWSLELRQKLSDARKGEKRLPFSLDWRKHLSDAKKGKPGHVPWNKGKKLPPLSEERRLQNSIANKGKKLSPETCKKMSDARKGKHIGGTSWNKGKTSWNKGISCSSETCQKISDACKGRIPWNKGRHE